MPKPELMKHRRIVFPAPVGGVLRRSCSCGWHGRVELRTLPSSTVSEAQDALELAYVSHIPESERHAYVLVDQRPGCEGQWLMPAGEPCGWSRFEGDDETGFRVDLEWPVRGQYAVGEVRTADGRIFRLE